MKKKHKDLIATSHCLDDLKKLLYPLIPEPKDYREMVGEDFPIFPGHVSKFLAECKRFQDEHLTDALENIRFKLNESFVDGIFYQPQEGRSFFLGESDSFIIDGIEKDASYKSGIRYDGVIANGERKGYRVQLDSELLEIIQD